jgi:hypothetical protein
MNISGSKNPPRPPSGLSVKQSSRSLAGVDTSDSGVMLPSSRWSGGGGGSGHSGQHQRDSLGSSKGNPIPPPPPPLHQAGSTSPQGSLHMRAESCGSISSLGSMITEDQEYARNRHAQTTRRRSLTRENGQSQSSSPAPPSPTGHLADVKKVDDGTEAPVPETPQNVVSHLRKNSFLDMLRMGWSPQSRNTPSGTSRKRPNIEDFHRHNQDFLHRETLLPILPAQAAAGVAPASSKQQHLRQGSQDHPPPSRGTHRRLQSISNDEWNEDEATEDDHNNEGKLPAIPNVGSGYLRHGGGINSSNEEASESRSQLDEDGNENDWDDNFEEHTSLLPPSGISSNEQEEKDSKYGSFSIRRSQKKHAPAGAGRIRPQQRSSIEKGSSRTLKTSSVSDATVPASKSMPSRSRNVDTDTSTQTDRRDNSTPSMARKARKKKYRRKSQKSRLNSESSERSEDSSDSNMDYRQWTKKRASMLEKERAKLIEQWKAEARAESGKSAKEEEPGQWHRQQWRHAVAEFQKFATITFRGLTFVEAFIGNLPLTIGAVSLSIVSLGGKYRRPIDRTAYLFPNRSVTVRLMLIHFSKLFGLNLRRSIWIRANQSISTRRSVLSRSFQVRPVYDFCTQFLFLFFVPLTFFEIFRLFLLRHERETIQSCHWFSLFVQGNLWTVGDAYSGENPLSDQSRDG